MVTYDIVRDLARRLPGVEEGTSYGTAALKVKGKLLVRLKEDGETIVLRTDPIEREHLLRTARRRSYASCSKTRGAASRRSASSPRTTPSRPGNALPNARNQSPSEIAVAVQ